MSDRLLLTTHSDNLGQCPWWMDHANITTRHNENFVKCRFWCTFAACGWTKCNNAWNKFNSCTEQKGVFCCVLPSPVTPQTQKMIFLFTQINGSILCLSLMHSSLDIFVICFCCVHGLRRVHSITVQFRHIHCFDEILDQLDVFLCPFLF